MANLFKSKTTRYVDANGRKVRKGDPGARKQQVVSKKWYGQYRDENNVVRRVPLAADKAAARAMLNELVLKVERKKAGVSDPSEEHQQRTLKEHLAEYREYLSGKNSTKKHVGQTIRRINKLMDGCGFVRLSDLDAPKVVSWLADCRRTRKRFSAQTSNFYQDAVKSFATWLAEHDRIHKSPFGSLKRLSVDEDRKHDRRALSDEEFVRLVAAAEIGGVIEATTGKVRAMLYILAAWTGFRRRELSSLTRKSFQLDADPPTVQVSAAYSKRGKKDTIPLHPTVAERLQEWFSSERFGLREKLFPLELPSGYFRKTAKMMQLDLAAAKKQWIEEADTEEERNDRSESDFLTYQDENGLYADFHANRHTFISRLGRAGVSIMTAQKLARHSDPRLTSNVYNHVDTQEKADAISLLPGAPGEASVRTSDATENGFALRFARPAGAAGQDGSSGGKEAQEEQTEADEQKSFDERTLASFCDLLSQLGEVHPRGFEPLTFGSVDRCSIQLS